MEKWKINVLGEILKRVRIFIKQKEVNSLQFHLSTVIRSFLEGLDITSRY